MGKQPNYFFLIRKKRVEIELKEGIIIKRIRKKGFFDSIH